MTAPAVPRVNVEVVVVIVVEQLVIEIYDVCRRRLKKERFFILSHSGSASSISCREESTTSLLRIGSERSRE